MSHPGLLNDVLFKIVFGTQQSEPILRALLNALLGYVGDRRIVALTILNPNLDKQFVEEKGSILDVKARDASGRLYNIEVQVSAGRGDYVKRSLFYLARLYCEQLERGQPYSKLAKTISISLLDFVLFEQTDQLHNTFQLREVTQGHVLSDVLELHYIELKKFCPNKPLHLRSSFEKWLYILKFSDIYAPEINPLPEVLNQEEGITMAIDSMRKAYAVDEVREMIQAREKAERDYLSGLHDAREAGREEGREAGREAGREEGQRQFARRMLASGLSPQQIQELTGASPEDLSRWLGEPGEVPG